MTAQPDTRTKIPPNGNLTIAIYLAVTGLSAACGLVIEIVAGRMIAPYLGMSLYTWTAVIAVVWQASPSGTGLAAGLPRSHPGLPAVRLP